MYAGKCRCYQIHHVPHVSGTETLQKVQVGIGTFRFCKEMGICRAGEGKRSLFGNSSHTGVVI